MNQTERLLWITAVGLGFIVGGEWADASNQRRVYHGMRVASTPAPEPIKNCDKQAIREHINACATRARMEKVKAP